MDVSREVCRAMIFYDYKGGLIFKESHDLHGKLLLESLLLLQQELRYWLREFKGGRETSADHQLQ